MNFEVKNGYVIKGEVFSDCLSTDFIEILNEELKDFKYNEEGVKEFIMKVRLRDMRFDNWMLELEDWLISNV